MNVCCTKMFWGKRIITCALYERPNTQACKFTSANILIAITRTLCKHKALHNSKHLQDWGSDSSLHFQAECCTLSSYLAYLRRKYQDVELNINSFFDFCLALHKPLLAPLTVHTYCKFKECGFKLKLYWIPLCLRLWQHIIGQKLNIVFFF